MEYVSKKKTKHLYQLMTYYMLVIEAIQDLKKPTEIARFLWSTYTYLGLCMCISRLNEYDRKNMDKSWLSNYTRGEHGFYCDTPFDVNYTKSRTIKVLQKRVELIQKEISRLENS